MTLDVQLNYVDSIEEAARLKRWMSERRPYIAVDTESEGLQWWRDRPRLLQVGDRDTAWAIPWDLWGGAILEILRDFDGDLIMHNAGFDVKMFEYWSGVQLPHHRIHDTRVQAHILQPNRPTGLKYLAERLVDRQAARSERLLKEAMTLNRWTWATVPVDFPLYWIYGALDTVLTARLHEQLHPQVLADAPRAYELEMATVWVLTAMERRGMALDVDFTREKLRRFQEYVEQCADWCTREYGVRAGSNALVVERLERDLRGIYQFTKLTPGGALCLDAEVLKDIIRVTQQVTGAPHPLAQTVYNRRRIQKLASAYLENFLDLEHNGRIHPSFNALKREREDTAGYGARTGRMSVSDPSLQNLPRRSNSHPAADAVRNCLVSSGGSHLLMCDFDQVEFRIVAHLSEDRALISAFLEGDFFVNLTREIFSDPTIEKGDFRRQTTKNAGYAKIYGAGVPKFAATAGISVQEGDSFMRRLDGLYPGLNQLANRVASVARERYALEEVAYVRSPLTGRRYPCDGPDKAYALVNYLVQGMAAEVLKMKNVELVKAGLGPYLTLNVHDEVLLDVPVEEFDDAGRATVAIMNDDQLFSVPLTASLEWGDRWGSKNPVTVPADA